MRAAISLSSWLSKAVRAGGSCSRSVEGRWKSERGLAVACLADGLRSIGRGLGFGRISIGGGAGRGQSRACGWGYRRFRVRDSADSMTGADGFGALFRDRGRAFRRVLWRARLAISARKLGAPGRPTAAIDSSTRWGRRTRRQPRNFERRTRYSETIQHRRGEQERAGDVHGRDQVIGHHGTGHAAGGDRHWRSVSS